jgi:hypothetical protein
LISLAIAYYIILIIAHSGGKYKWKGTGNREQGTGNAAAAF